jgi:hypothetical protein
MIEVIKLIFLLLIGLCVAVILSPCFMLTIVIAFISQIIASIKDFLNKIIIRR